MLVYWGPLASEESETCFVLPLRKAIAHFARWGARSTETEMGGSDNGSAHAGTDKSADFGAGFPPLLLGEPERQFIQHDCRFLAQETIG